MKSTFKNLELSSEVVPISVPGFCYAGRFQVVVEYAFGVCVPAAVAESQEEAEEAFLVQSQGCDKGEILLFDHGELRVVASVKWKMDTTENGLRVPFRKNVFHDLRFALLAFAMKKSRSVALAVELSA